MNAVCPLHGPTTGIRALDLTDDKSPTRRSVTVSVGIGCYDEVSACWADPGPEHRALGHRLQEVLRGLAAVELRTYIEEQ